MISSQEFKIICRMIKELETRLDDRLDGFGRKFIGMLQGFSILDPDRQTMTSREVCEQYGVSDRKIGRASGREIGVFWGGGGWG